MKLLWDCLMEASAKCDGTLHARLELIREDSCTIYSYGPDIRSFIDNHGQAIRNAGSAADILLSVQRCSCHIKYPDYVDHSVGHVRTQDTSILGPYLGPLAAKGLNFRPTFLTHPWEHVARAKLWAEKVLNARPVRRLNTDPTLKLFTKMLRRVNLSRHLAKPCTVHCPSGKQMVTATKLRKAAETVRRDFVCTSTDKATNTCSIECIHWYNALCLQRLTSPAFTVLQVDPQVEVDRQLQLVELHTPWATNIEFAPAILFGTAKMHKRHVDPLAERYITSACSAWSNPVSVELTEALTVISAEVRRHCIAKGHAAGGKFWWAIDSLDTVPLNLDTSYRPNRQPSAFDLEKAFESIPLSDGEHCLVKHVAYFLDIGLPVGTYVGCNYRWDGSPGARMITHQPDEFDFSYDASSLLQLLTDLLSMAVITVGDTWAKQHVGIPMGYNSSVILLNIYMFKPEYEFCCRLEQLAPDLLPMTTELFRYVDDLLNMSDVDLRPFLDPDRPQKSDCIFWIYPLAPIGPLGVEDQTEYGSNYTKVVYLDTVYTFSRGYTTFEWYTKTDKMSLHMDVNTYPHYKTNISRSCKMGILCAQARTMCRSASSMQALASNICRLATIFLQRGYPKHLVIELLISKSKLHLARLPISSS